MTKRDVALWIFSLVVVLSNIRDISPSRRSSPVALAKKFDRIKKTETPSTSTFRTTAPRTAGRFFGLLIGVNHYYGEHSLVGPAEDANDLRKILVNEGIANENDLYVHTDETANLGLIQDDIRLVAADAQMSDTFLFYFDGHGNREALGLPRQEITQSRLASWLQQIHTGHTIIVIDSCHAGAWEPLAWNDGRYGLFSSHAGELSSTAPRLKAGGFLAYFFEQSLLDLNVGGSTTFSDLQEYLQQRYDREAPTDQHLVVSTSIDAVLWNRTLTR